MIFQVLKVERKLTLISWVNASMVSKNKQTNKKGLYCHTVLGQQGRNALVWLSHEKQRYQTLSSKDKLEVGEDIYSVQAPGFCVYDN